MYKTNNSTGRKREGILTDTDIKKAMSVMGKKRQRNVVERARDIVGGAARGALQGARGY